MDTDSSAPSSRPTPGQRAALEPLPAEVRSIQPGGGFCMSVELLWGGVRRAIVKALFPGFVKKMAATRRGVDKGCPHEVLDPRDVKFYRNQGGYYWLPADDPFQWRDRLPVARAGLAELLIIAGTFFLIAAVVGYFYWPASIVPAGLGLFVISFFRNPRRPIPTDPGLVVSPADGKIVLIEEIPHDDFIGGPAVLVGIFLSVFNVHINRVPVASRIVGLTYKKGKFLNALRASSARENEQMILRIEESHAPHRRMIVRQIAGAIARRIVCWVAPGDELGRGDQFGMIKLGSRTELVIPKDSDLAIKIRVGDNVKAGLTVIARYDRPEVV
jgi:phosphatidylserine decarboxylase